MQSIQQAAETMKGSPSATNDKNKKDVPFCDEELEQCKCNKQKYLDMLEKQVVNSELRTQNSESFYLTEDLKQFKEATKEFMNLFHKKNNLFCFIKRISKNCKQLHI